MAYYATSELHLPYLVGGWYEDHSFCLGITERFWAAGSFLTAKMIIDMVHSILLCPNRNFLHCEVHHLVTILLDQIIVLPAVCFLGVPLSVTSASLELGSAILCVENVLRDQMERWPVFCIIHDYMFRFFDIFGLLTYIPPFCKELSVMGPGISPLGVIIFVLPVGVIISRQLMFIPSSKRIEMRKNEMRKKKKT